jgi:nucleotide-binding universal stress UspA family protein
MNNVIACIDGTAVSSAVCDYAAWAGLRLAAPLTLLHVLDKAAYPIKTNLSGNIGLGSREALLEELAALDERRGRLALEQGRLMLEEAQHRVINDGVADPATLQRHGSLIETLVDLEPELRLLVLGKHDENLNEHIGSRLENVVRILHRPILVTTDTYRPPRRFMIAYDGSETTRKGVEMIAASPLFLGLPCHLLMIGADSKANQGQLAWARDCLEAAGFEVHTALRAGEVERTLCDYRAEQDIDLLVMGAYGHSIIRRFLVGSTTTSVMRNATVPVLLLR